MNTFNDVPKKLSHQQLLARLHDLVDREHSREAELIAHLAEVDVRRLYLEQKRGAVSSPITVRATDSTANSASALTTAPALESAATNSRPKKPSRKIPTAIRRRVWERDEGQCSYVSREGRRCGTRDFLEFHHQVPWARCREHREPNIHLRCRAHNQHAAVLDFGPQHMAGFRKLNGAAADELAANGTPVPT